MKNIQNLKSNIKNGHHLNSKYWQNYKKTVPLLSKDLFGIAIGCLLGDANFYRVSKHAKIKFEQGFIHKEYLFHLFELFKIYTFHSEPYTRFENKGIKKGEIKSYSFRTFTHPTFDELYNLFIEDKRKSVIRSITLNHLTEKGLTFWIMDDGSLQKDKKSLIIHTQSYTESEVKLLSTELNQKFNLHSRVIPHKIKYYVILIPSQDAQCLYNLIASHIYFSMSYKLPIL